MLSRLILLNPNCASGRESPIRIEFEDEKTSTLLELLNQISEEINHPRQSIKPCWRPPLSTVSTRAMGASNDWSRSYTAPELQLNRKSAPQPQPQQQPQPTPSRVANRTRELPLCPSKLVTASAPTAKKTAPSAPHAPAPAAKAPATVNSGNRARATMPFSVELGLGRGSLHRVQPSHSNAFDIHVVDLDERNPSSTALDKDNMSDVSSVLSMSPKRPNP